MSANQSVDYYEIEDLLVRAQAPLDAADCHGLLAGLVCAVGSADPRLWMTQVFDDYNPKDDAPLDAADCHGLLAGLVCAVGSADPRLWMTQVFDDYNPKDDAQVAAAKRLQALYEETLAGLNSPALEFALLLPDDDDSLRERAESLGGWCGGFLSGLGLGGVSDAQQLPEAIGELLQDLTQIARVDFELDTPDEAELAAFEEVLEFVRIGVLYINEELQPSRAPARLQ